MKRAHRLRAIPRWGLIAIGLLGVHVTAMLLAVRIATSDSSFTSVPGYYRQAVDWDKLQAKRRASAELGWSVDVEPSVLRDRLVLTVVDADGEPIEGLTGELEAYHHRHAQSIATAALEPRGDGVYFAAIDVTEVGAWQLRLEGLRGTDEALFDERELVVAAAKVAR